MLRHLVDMLTDQSHDSQQVVTLKDHSARPLREETGGHFVDVTFGGAFRLSFSQFTGDCQTSFTFHSQVQVLRSVSSCPLDAGYYKLLGQASS
jgi:hypothetical protein